MYNQDGTQYYAIRRLSPFQGLWHILKTPDGTAVSPNGEIWQIRVAVELNRPGWGSLDKQHKESQFCLYGTWRNTSGLQRAPLNPMVDLQTAIKLADKVVKYLGTHYRSVPFPIEDNYELWLLDKKTLLPTALIASTNNETRIITRNNYDWLPFNTNEQDLGHLQNLMNQAGIEMDITQAREQLRHMIKQSCGFTATAQWFERNDDGSGIGMLSMHTDTCLQARHLDEAEFPSLLVRRNWDNERDQKLMQCYLEWISPALLCLPSLSYHERDALELAALQQPLELLDHANAYPDIIHREKLNAALVEAKIRVSSKAH